MMRDELLRRLEEEGVDCGAYDLDATQKDEVYCLEPRGTSWVYYYRERGIRRDEHVFTSLGEAARHFLDRVLKDPTTRLRR
jgi:hypothetical protein